MKTSVVFDELEQQPPEQRERALFAGFSQRLQEACESCPGLRSHLRGRDISAVSNREALTKLPVLRKSDLMQAQQSDPPFGGFVPRHAQSGTRVFMSPGPVWEPQISGIDPWQAARALFAAGIRSGDRIHNTFAYHVTPGGFILDEGALALGCLVFPAGVGNTESQVAAIRQLRPSVYTGTPDYLQTLLDHAKQAGQPLTGFQRALVSGGALFPAMRDEYSEQGIAVQQCYATADFGVIAYETATDGLVHPGMIVNENLIVEILIPGTGMPVKPGEVGEIVVTRLHRDYPLLRFATGDLSAENPEPSPCGRSGMRIKGWMGRADQRTKVRGMFVDPVQLSRLGRDYPEIDRWRLVIERQDNKDVMNLQVTLHDTGAAVQREWLDSVAASLKAATQLSGTVEQVRSLPADGIVVEDRRNYD
ncbi:MAG: phenylacetate--CoA ligase family protein [Granulosicoccus sp.]